MNRNIYFPLSILVACTVFFWWATLLYAHAAVPDVYTNDNIWTSEHDKPVWFEQDAAGNFRGQTETGKWFTQRAITNTLNIKLHRFAIDEAFYYVSDKGIITADNDTVALSIYLARTS